MSQVLSIGGAEYTVTADYSAFNAAMAKGESAAKRSSQSIESSLKRVEAAQKRAGATAAAQAQKHQRQVAQTMLQIGFLADDLQYGFRSIVNNIPMVFNALGKPGLAGGVAIAAVAVNQLVEHWGQLTSAFQSQWLNVPMERLEKLRIMAEKSAEAFDNLMRTPSTVEAKEVSMLKEAIVKEGPKNVRDKLLQVVKTDPAEMQNLRMDPQHQNDLALLAKMKDNRIAINMGLKAIGGPLVPLAATDALISALEKKIAKNFEASKGKRVDEIMGGALQPGEEGKQFRDTFRRLMRKISEVMSGDFRSGLENSRPEAIARQIAEQRQEAARNAIEARLNREQARDQGIASQILHSPLGREIVMGGGGAGAAAPGGPVTKAQAMAMVRKSRFLNRFLLKETREDFASHLQGLSPEQAAQVMQGVTPQAAEKIAKEKFPRRKHANGEWIDKTERIGKGAAQLLTDRAAEARKNPPPAAKPKPDALKAKVNAAMEAAGAIGEPEGVIQEVRAMHEKRVQQLMLERGLTKPQANLAAMRENIQHNLPGALPRGGQILDPVAFSRMAHGLIQGTKGQDPQLQAMNQAVDYLKQLVDAAKIPKLGVAAN